MQSHNGTPANKPYCWSNSQSILENAFLQKNYSIAGNKSDAVVATKSSTAY